MDVLKIILVMAFAVYLIRRDIFISKFKLKVGLKGMELDISTEEKNGPSSKNDRSDLN